MDFLLLLPHQLTQSKEISELYKMTRINHSSISCFHFQLLESSKLSQSIYYKSRKLLLSELIFLNEKAKPLQKKDITNEFICSRFKDHPPITSPFGPKTVKLINIPANIKIKIPIILFENLRKNNAYKIFAIYSKKSDQAGPSSGCISPQPLISIDGRIGSNVKPIIIVKINFHTGIPAI